MSELFDPGYSGLFVASFLAATIIPFSSDALLGIMIATGYDLPMTLLCGTVGNSLGGMTSYYLGRLGRWVWLEKYFGIKKEKIAKFEYRVRKYADASALLTWLPFIGDLLAVALGVLRRPPLRVIALMATGKFLRYLIIALMVNGFFN